MQRMTADPPLPTSVTKAPKTVPLLVGDDLSKTPQGKKATCQLRLLTDPGGAPLSVSLNSNDLGEGKVADDKFREFRVAVDHVRHGGNTLAVALRGDPQTGRLSRLHLWVRFTVSG